MLILGGVAGNAAATTICVHDTAELGSALFTAEANTSSDTIRLARGTFVRNAAINFKNLLSNLGLYLSGGWDA